MIESSFGLHVNAGVTKLPTRPIFTVVLFTSAGIANQGDFDDPGAIRGGAAPSYRPYAVHASWNSNKSCQLVHLDKRWVDLIAVV
jgi:hypothetical protein